MFRVAAGRGNRGGIDACPSQLGIRRSIDDALLQLQVCRSAVESQRAMVREDSGLKSLRDCNAKERDTEPWM